MISKRIFQTFEHGDFNPEFQKLVDDWRLENPDYDYQFFDANDREIFMRHFFEGEVYNAYMRLLPGAFQSDLWRYCILYTYGGFYVDIDSICLGSLDMFMNEDTEFVAGVDLNLGDLEYHNVANAFIGSTQGHPILKSCIDHIVEIIKKEELPAENIMNFCGPGCLGININRYLGRKDKASMVGYAGKYGKVDLITFEHPSEFFRGLDGRKIMQNKNSSPLLKRTYADECAKVEDYFDWGKFGFKNIPFNWLVKVDPLTKDPTVYTIENYHNGEDAYFNLFKYCGVSDCIRRGVKWEEHNHRLIDQYVNKDSIAIEVGAHIGTITTKLSKVANEVHAFEPIETTFDMLRTNLNLNNCSNTTIYQAGCGDRVKKTKVKWISDNNAGGTGLEGGVLTKDSNIDEDIIVDVVTLDSMQFDRVDYIKIDAEGYEELVIKGAENIIIKNKPLIVMELFNKDTFNNHKIDAARATDEEIKERFGFLINLGYIYEHVYFEDFVFIPPKLQVK